MVRKEIDSAGTIRYYNDKYEFHRVDGPAIEYYSGEKKWFINGERHRIGGPAVETAKCNSWFKNGNRHRLNAPAIIYSDGAIEFWEFGEPR